MATTEALAKFRELNGDRPPSAEELSGLSGLDVALCAEILKSPEQEAVVGKPQEPEAEKAKKRRRGKKPEVSAEEAEQPKVRKTAAKAKAQQSKPKDGETPGPVAPVAVVPAEEAPPVTPPCRTPPVPATPKGQQLLQFKSPQAWSSTCRFTF